MAGMYALLACVIGAPPIQVTYWPDHVALGIPHEEVIANIYPVSDSVAGAGPKKVFVQVRGGNENFLEMLQPGQIPPSNSTADAVNAVGFTYVVPNIPLFDGISTDMTIAATAAGRLVQYLRHHAAALNIDPNGIAMMGGSAGGVSTLWNCYHKNLIDENTSHYSHSSQPNACIAERAPTKLDCLFPCQGPETLASQALYPGQTFAELTPEQKDMWSSTWWLSHVQREADPPLLLVYDSNIKSGQCGTALDVHDHIFGPLMLDAMDRYAKRKRDTRLAATTFLIDVATYDTEDAWAYSIHSWAHARLNEAMGQMNLVVPPGSPINPCVGESKVFSVWGAEPGAAISFAYGTKLLEAPVEINLGCGTVSVEIADFGFLGEAVADQHGLARLTVSLPAEVINHPYYVQAINIASCSATPAQSVTFVAPANSDCDAGSCLDCNNNKIFDSCDISLGTSKDSNHNGIPDECVEEGDCNLNGIGDLQDIDSGNSLDKNCNTIPDECEGVCSIPDLLASICEFLPTQCGTPDCNNNGSADVFDICSGYSDDCDMNGVPDECQGKCNIGGAGSGMSSGGQL